MANITTKADLYYPNTSAIDNDFIGFSFNGVTSTQLGISRVSDGSRYNEQMLPGFQDKSAQMPGSDYTLYWESFYNTRTWNLNIAFDHMIDDQMALFRKTFNTKNMGELKFAERTYVHGENDIREIHWLAKVQSPPQLKYICFNEGGNRIYKGEGTLTFVSYYPFGMSDLKSEINIASSSILNNGDIPTDWYVVLTAARAVGLGEVEVQVNGSAIGQLGFNNITMETGDSYLIINSKTNLVEGAKTYNSSTGKYTSTGNVYNKYISYGDFFQIPVGQSQFLIMPAQDTSGYVGNLHYTYLYL